MTLWAALFAPPKPRSPARNAALGVRILHNNGSQIGVRGRNRPMHTRRTLRSDALPPHRNFYAPLRRCAATGRPSMFETHRAAVPQSPNNLVIEDRKRRVHLPYFCECHRLSSCRLAAAGCPAIPETHRAAVSRSFDDLVVAVSLLGHPAGVGDCGPYFLLGKAIRHSGRRDNVLFHHD